MRTALRILGFRATHEELRDLDRRHLALGLLLTWLVGMGWWEDPNANLLQHLGVGSVVYVFVLALLLWMISRPLMQTAASYENVLTYVTLTAPPAILYAAPVRSWFELATAQQVRLWFLAIVAGWRVLLWARYLRVGARLSRPAVVVGTVFPLVLIVVALVALNLERVVFNIMGGALRPEQVSVNDTAYGVLFLLSLLSVLLFVPLLIWYGFLVTRAWEMARTTGQ